MDTALGSTTNQTATDGISGNKWRNQLRSINSNAGGSVGDVMGFDEALAPIRNAVKELQEQSDQTKE